LEIIIPKKQSLTFKPTELESDGKMPDKATDDNWKELQRLIKKKLGLHKSSCFVLVRVDNTEDQIEDGEQLQELWDQLISSKSKNSYELEMLCLLIEKEKETVAWHPKGANHPNFGGNLEKEDWEKHFDDLKELVKVPEDGWLENTKDEDITIKENKQLKKIWSNRYKKGEPRSLQFKVKSSNNDSDNDRKTTRNSKKK